MKNKILKTQTGTKCHAEFISASQTPNQVDCHLASHRGDIKVIFKYLICVFYFWYLIFNFSVARAGVCIWRFPDKDIQTLFPKATGYKTEVLTYSKQERVKIESLLGAKLDDDETKFNFYRIKKDTTKIGLVLTHSVKGQYGVIEVVVGLNNKAEVIGVLIQRDREIKSKELRSNKFLEQFLNKMAKSKFDDIKSVKGAEKASKAVVLSVRKLLIVNKILGHVPNQQGEK